MKTILGMWTALIDIDAINLCEIGKQKTRTTLNITYYDSEHNA